MKRQNHLSLDRHVRKLTENSIRNLIVFVAALFALYLSPYAAKAQFSGPSLGVSSAVNSPMTPTTDPTILYPANRDIVLGQGDLLSVHLFGNTDYQPELRISLNGTVQLPLIGSLHLEGLTLHQAENLIAERLTSGGMYLSPQINIQLTESPNQIITLTGELHGLIPVAGQKRLLDVLSVAGGLTPTSSHTIVINRPGVAEPIVIDLGTDPSKSKYSNVPVFAQDTIIVPRVGVVYLLGAFKVQGPIPLPPNEPLTLMQAASMGGGVGFEGKQNDLRIVRTVGFDRKVVTVDIHKVLQGKAPDPVLQADDIVLLPTSKMKAAIKSGGIATVTGIASILVLAFRY